MDLFPKFIIERDEEEGDCLIISKVTYHRDLVTIKEEVKGGGWFHYDSEINAFTFYGESHDFGASTFEDIKACVENKKVFSSPLLVCNISERHSFYYDYKNGEEPIKLI